MKHNKRIIFIFILTLAFCAAAFAACKLTEAKLSVDFDETHTVTEGDSLDGIKPYLTVNYTDEHNKTRRLDNGEYELSGTLKAGDNVLTVSYKELQATFSVTAQPAAHQHSYTEWRYNDSEHWKACPDDGATDDDARAAHSFDEEGLCECGYKQPEPVKGTRDNPYSPSEAYALAAQMSEEYSDEVVYVKGRVAAAAQNAMGDWMIDVTDDAVMFKLINAKLSYSGSDEIFPTAGDEVLAYGYLYNGKDVGLRSGDVQCTVAELITDRQMPPVLTLAAEKNLLYVGDSTEIIVTVLPQTYADSVKLEILRGENLCRLEGTTLYAVAEGEVVLRASITANGKTYAKEIVLRIEQAISNVEISLVADKYLIELSQRAVVRATVTPADYAQQLRFEIVSGEDVASLEGDSTTSRTVFPLKAGYVTVVASIGNFRSDPVTVQILCADPYANMGASGFHNNNYKPAADLQDSYWRTKHNLMSGSIADQDPTPTLSSYIPMQGNKYVRNIDENYYDNGNSYKIVDGSGNVVNTIYKCGAYVSLEEVAAYVYAWGDVPANYITSNKGDPESNAWGEFLRLNHNVFSGDTSRYPYEPVLPNISGCGGTYRYYEIDIGTTGTHTPGYTVAPYNNGKKITRGAARIVYARYEGSRLLSPSERYVFYTYNHYNDFQEYLNYQGGWGEMFGNITGGGQYNSGRNPSPYVDVAKSSFGCKG